MKKTKTRGVLVLARRAGQKLVIGDVVLQVVSIHENRVVLSFKGPRGVSILREELLQRKESE